jgi:hypothetical protein
MKLGMSSCPARSGGRSGMEEKVNPDILCQNALNAKMEMYRAKEMGEAVLKNYNDRMDELVNVIQLMKARILEMERKLADLEGKEEPEAKL